MLDLDRVGHLDLVGDVIGAPGGQDGIARARHLDGVEAREGLLRGPGFGQPHGIMHVEVAEAGGVAEMLATAVEIVGTVGDPAIADRQIVGQAVAPRRERQDLLNIAIAQIRVRLEHQRDRG